MLQDFFYFPKSERRAIFCLTILLAGLVVCLCLTPDEETMVTTGEDCVDTLRAQTVEAVLPPHPENEKPVHRQEVSSSPRPMAAKERKPFYSSANGKRDTLLYPSKYSEGTVVDLNRADTTELRRIPGIGPVFSRRIVAYRELLGGYARVEQLREVYGLEDDFSQWFTIKTPPYRRLNLNRLGVKELVRHPYLTYAQARAIVNHRKQFGRIDSLSQLSLYEEFSAEELKRIEPYVEF